MSGGRSLFRSAMRVDAGPSDPSTYLTVYRLASIVSGTLRTKR